MMVSELINHLKKGLEEYGDGEVECLFKGVRYQLVTEIPPREPGVLDLTHYAVIDIGAGALIEGDY